jgi:hypothetical protein
MTRHATQTFSPTSAFAHTLRGAETARQTRLPRRYETPVFSPSSAFARTLRGGEIARSERRPRPDAGRGVLRRAGFS